MRRFNRSMLTVMLTTALLAVINGPVFAQSGTRTSPPSGSSGRAPTAAGSGLRSAEQAPVALEGYCPVSVQGMKKWVKGSPSIRSVFDGHTYYFANQQGKQMCDADPAQYAPVLGGDCVVSYAKMGKRVPGNIRRAAFYDGRLFLFANEQGKQMFLSDRDAFADADLAYGGNCVVCNVNMRQSVPGKPELAVTYKGLRYLFASPDQRAEFLANPEKYAVADTAAPASSGGSGNRQPATSGSGSRPGSGTRG